MFFDNGVKYSTYTVNKERRYESEFQRRAQGRCRGGSLVGIENQLAVAEIRDLALDSLGAPLQITDFLLHDPEGTLFHAVIHAVHRMLAQDQKLSRYRVSVGRPERIGVDCGDVRCGV